MYKFVAIPDCRMLRNELLDFCTAHGIKGTIILANEGINGTISGSPGEIDNVINYLRKYTVFSDLEFKYSEFNETPFYRMKVKIKREIVTMGIPQINPDKLVGKYMDAKEWNDLITEPDVLVLDTRNQYEYEIGTFKNAVSPNTETFREFPEFVENNLDHERHRKIAMFCTGGIRCEKATSYLLSKGFENVFHLQGGILKYLEDVSQQENLWEGDCFVFDNRVAVDKNLKKGGYEMCFACRMPVSPNDKLSEFYQEGISCPRCYDKTSAEKRKGLAERQKQVQLAAQRNDQHIGKKLQKSCA